MTIGEPIIRTRNLRKVFPVMSGTFRRRQVSEVVAIDDVNLDIHAGEVVGCVGETGSGKSTLGRLILNLVRPDFGQVWLDGTRIDNLPPAMMRVHRRQMQMVFQDPLQALNPRRTVAENIGLPLVNFGEPASEISHRVRELLDLVGLNPAHANRYPHEFSGGQCQRIGIARAVALNPRFLFLDEPVSALDVSVQAQILNLLLDLRRRLNLTYLFVTHDLKIVRHIADRIIVLYRGKILESGPSDAVYGAPRHPYSRALIDSILRTEGNERWKVIAQRDADGDVDSDAAGFRADERVGCIYTAACPECFAPCQTVVPQPLMVAPGHEVACHLYAGDPSASRSEQQGSAKLLRAKERINQTTNQTEGGR
jgi:oligopeptide/dipeptide ABC transporter ATP-binding protein